MTLTTGDSIVTAWAESCGGSGWRNRVVWVLVRSSDGTLRIEDIQGGEMSTALTILFGISTAVTRQVTFEVQAIQRSFTK